MRTPPGEVTYKSRNKVIQTALVCLILKKQKEIYHLDLSFLTF